MSSSRPVAAVFALVGASVVAHACASPASAPPPPPTAARVTTASAPPRGSEREIAGTPPSAAPADPSPPPDPPTPPRDGAAGSTRGTIACGTRRCQAGKEACTIDPTSRDWVCVPGSDGLEGGGYRCDDGTDCPQGETCCMSFASASTWVSCTTRDNDCATEVCAPGGARCPAGQVCRDGACRVDARARCAKGVCPGDKPVCLWGKQPRCVSHREAAAADAALLERDEAGFTGVYACTQRADCGTLQCCTGALGPDLTFCANQCDLANTRIVCSTDADCRSLSAAYCPGRSCARCKRPEADEAAALPPWMKLCALGE